MIRTESVQRAVAEHQYKVISYLNCPEGVRDAAYMIRDLDHNLPPLLKSSYCSCVQLKTIEYTGFQNLPQVDYLVLSARDDILGCVSEFRLNERVRQTVFANVPVELKVLTENRDTVWFFDWTQLRLIRAMFDPQCLTKHVVLKYDLTSMDSKDYLGKIQHALSYALWKDFRKQTHADFDFEEAD